MENRTGQKQIELKKKEYSYVICVQQLDLKTIEKMWKVLRVSNFFHCFRKLVTVLL